MPQKTKTSPTCPVMAVKHQYKRVNIRTEELWDFVAEDEKALKAEIDEEAWVSLYSTTSRPLDPPQTGKIAVKVINHYGDEVLKVYEVCP